VDSRSEEALVEFARARQAVLFRTAFLLTGDRGHAEDLLQGTMERTYQHWRRVASTGNPDAYVRRIMVNLARDGWRSRRHAVEQRLDEAFTAPVQGMQVDQTEQAESRALLVRALRGYRLGCAPCWCCAISGNCRRPRPPQRWAVLSGT
jgi:DNA-directed RNA polymerase specialized sigma24 family protein